jgi:hypothetical protein
LAEWDRQHANSSPEEKQRDLFLRSPYRVGDIQIRYLEDCPNYYDNLFAEMKQNYNHKVDELTVAQNGIGEVPQAVARIVRLYRETTEADRGDLADTMAAAILLSKMPRERKTSLTELIRTAANPPIVLA